MRNVGRILERSLSNEIICGRPEHLKVFVSSQMRDGVLADERRAAIEAIDSQPYHRAWAWERDAKAGPYSSEKVCLGHAETSDALVLILADDLTKITAREYKAARKACVPRFVLLKDGASRTDVAEKFVTRERKRDVITVNFGNLAEVKTQIREALRNHILWTQRGSIARARSGRP
jgi:Domain of unknown function (DUF4062)